MLPRAWVCGTLTAADAGDLAKKKIYPALFALFYEGMLPQDFMIYGYARSDMTDDAFRESIMAMLPCRLSDAEDCSKKMDAFMGRQAAPAAEPGHRAGLFQNCSSLLTASLGQLPAS